MAELTVSFGGRLTLAAARLETLGPAALQAAMDRHLEPVFSTAETRWPVSKGTSRRSLAYMSTPLPAAARVALMGLAPYTSEIRAKVHDGARTWDVLVRVPSLERRPAMLQDGARALQGVLRGD